MSRHLGNVYVLALVASVLHTVRCLQATRWRCDAAFSNLVANKADITSPSPARNAVQCGKTCANSLECNSFFYSSATGQCWPQRAVFLDGADTKPAAGLRYFRLVADSCPAADGNFVHRPSSTCFKMAATWILKWTAARDGCVTSYGGQLAVLHPRHKIEFMLLMITSNPTVFVKIGTSIMIGAARPDGKWNTPFTSGAASQHQWVDGTWVDMEETGPFWAAGNPNNGKGTANILCLKPNKGFLLDDVDSADKRRFICEKPYLG